MTGTVDLSDVLPRGVTVVHNPRWQVGIATSLACGLELAGAFGLGAGVVGLGDQPMVPAAWRAVAASGSKVAVATYGGSRGNPVRLHRWIWSELPRSGDEGARALMRARPELVDEVPCPGDPRDIDSVDDVRPVDRREIAGCPPGRRRAPLGQWPGTGPRLTSVAVEWRMRRALPRGHDQRKAISGGYGQPGGILRRLRNGERSGTVADQAHQ